MPIERQGHRKPRGIFFLWTLLAGFVLIIVCVSFVVFRPDPPVATIVPGSSSAPTFVVQVIRPRLGLPLGGIVPPQLFGLDASLTFDSTTSGATFGSVGPDRIELRADEWELVLVLDGDGRVSPETYVVFRIVFQDRLRRVRCLPGDPTDGTLNTTFATTGQLSGSFDIELARCEDFDTGEPLGWPSKPLVLHGSFDRLPLGMGTEPQ